MSHQLNFFLTPIDTESLVIKLKDITPLLILHHRSDGPNPHLLQSLDYYEESGPLLFFCLVRPEDLGLVVMKNIPGQGHWMIDVLRSPIIEFNKCFFDQKLLRRGRIYYNDWYYGANNSRINKNISFDKWAKSIFSTTRRALKRYNSDYIGSDAQEWIESYGGTLVDR